MALGAKVIYILFKVYQGVDFVYNLAKTEIWDMVRKYNLWTEKPPRKYLFHQSFSFSNFINLIKVNKLFTKQILPNLFTFFVTPIGSFW